MSVFVDELLLGPMTYRYRYLFTPGTVAEFCFTKGKTLYVGLSEDALAVHDEVLPVEQGIELLKKNVKENFPRIDDVVVFIGNSEFSLEKSAESAEN